MILNDFTEVAMIIKNITDDYLYFDYEVEDGIILPLIYDFELEKLHIDSDRVMTDEEELKFDTLLEKYEADIFNEVDLNEYDERIPYSVAVKEMNDYYYSTR